MGFGVGSVMVMVQVSKDYSHSSMWGECSSCKKWITSQGVKLVKQRSEAGQAKRLKGA